MLVGQAELDIRAIGSHFTSDINTVVKPGMTEVAKAGDASAKNVGKSFGLMWKSVAQNAGGAFAPVTDMLSNIEGLTESLHSKAIGLRATAAGAAGAGIGLGLQAAGSSEKAAQDQLRASIEATGGVWEQYGTKIDGAVKHGEDLAFSTQQTYSALTRLTVGLQDPAKALDKLGFAMDVAKLKHISLDSASQLVISGYMGQTRALKTLGVQMSAGKHSQDEINAAMGEAAQHVANQAAASVNNFSGRLDVMKTKLEDQVSLFGQHYGPAITIASTAVMGIGSTMTITGAVVDRFRQKNMLAAESEAAVGTSATTAAGEVEAGTAQMAASTTTNMTRIAKGVGIAAGAIGAFEIGSHASSGTGATLGGAVSGAVAGLAVGGPFGAAIGGAGGALIGLASHFHHTAQEVDATTTALKGMTSQLVEALRLDKGKLGQNTRQWLETYLQDNPKITAELAREKVSEQTLLQYLRGGVMADVPHGEAQSSAATNIMQTIMQALLAAEKQNAALLQVIGTGGGGGHHHRGPAPGSPGFNVGVRAAGGPIYPGMSYIVGERGPEMIRPGQTAWVDPSIPSGNHRLEALLEQLCQHTFAMRMDIQQTTQAARAVSRAVEDHPVKHASQMRMYDHKFSSPSLLTL